MLLTAGSFLSPTSIKFPSKRFEKSRRDPLQIKFSINGICFKTSIPLLYSNYTNENKCIKRNRKRIAAISNSDQQPFELMEEHGVDHGIGIVEFFEGKNILITGATGFFGKVLVEKLLRSTGTGKIFLLIKAKDKDAAFDRLTKEILNSELFKCLKEKHGTCYEAFVRSKLIPIVGDICEQNLGIDPDDIDVIKREVNVIIQSAAVTTMTGRYDLLLDTNVIAPQRLMRFAKTCRNLQLFTHISTAYVNGSREGIIMERPLTMGKNARKDDEDEISSTNLPPLDPAHEMKLAFSSCNSASTDYDLTKEMRRLGQERSELYGWHNVYQMTKAMCEMSLNEIKGDVPLLIIRPSIIESSYKEPFPGWIQGNRVLDPLLIAFGKGQFPAMLGVPEAYLDIIPVDMVANTTIAAIAKHGRVHKPDLSVYHVASGTLNPLRYSEYFEFLYEYFNSAPLLGRETIEKIKFIDNFNDLSKYTQEEIFRRALIGHTDDRAKMSYSQCKAKVAYAEQLCNTYKVTGFFKARFCIGNTRKLLREMSEEEKLNFEVDATKLDWRKYFQKTHIPGLMKHVIKGRHSY